eukprot:TRINITY_DN74889_c0_g1_i1.p1 TRINITY_DN74889_c0_g1~~TRINITY_DN74889_c0_g1_i1.p1  ORF type:complete len:168 (+),score=11.45 TRINITY_DN74889_c0_g1_i1:3-506(+)
MGHPYHCSSIQEGNGFTHRANSAPCDQNKVGIACPGPRSQAVTDVDKIISTVHMSGLPCEIDCDRMMSVLEKLGYDGHYDFLNIPQNRTNVFNSCYGFIRFMYEDAATHFVANYAKYQFAGSGQARPTTALKAELVLKQAQTATISAMRSASCRFNPAGLYAKVVTL